MSKLWAVDDLLFAGGKGGIDSILSMLAGIASSEWVHTLSSDNPSRLKWPMIEDTFDAQLFPSILLVQFIIHQTHVPLIMSCHLRTSAQQTGTSTFYALAFRAVLTKLELHSSYDLPAPKPNPTKAGHARRLKRRTEKTTPNPRPREERISIDERQRSHYRCIVSL